MQARILHVRGSTAAERCAYETAETCDTLAIMEGDRRAAPRHLVPSDVTADVSGVPARLLELSLAGAQVEHSDRFALTLPRLNMTWRGNAASVAVRAARSEIVGRNGDRLLYRTGLYFVDVNSITRGFIASILEG